MSQRWRRGFRASLGVLPRRRHRPDDVIGGWGRALGFNAPGASLRGSALTQGGTLAQAGTPYPGRCPSPMTSIHRDDNPPGAVALALGGNPCPRRWP